MIVFTIMTIMPFPLLPGSVLYLYLKLLLSLLLSLSDMATLAVEFTDSILSCYCQCVILLL